MEESKIIFRGHEMLQCHNNSTKRLLLDKIYDLTKQRVLDKNQNKLGYMTDTFWKVPTFFTVLTEGERYWFLMTHVGDKQCIFLIHRYIKNGYPYPKMFDISSFVKCSNDAFYDTTLIECEILGGSRKGDVTPLTVPPLTLLFSDLCIQSGRNTILANPCIRFANLHTISKTLNISDQNVLNIQTKRVFHKRSWRSLIPFLKDMKYKVIGLCFYSCSSSGDALRPRVWMDFGQELYRRI